MFMTKDMAKYLESDGSTFEQQLYKSNIINFQVVFFSPEACVTIP